MNITPIKNEHDYELALKRLEIVFDSAPDTLEGDEAELLSMMIENYENRYNEKMKEWNMVKEEFIAKENIIKNNK